MKFIATNGTQKKAFDTYLGAKLFADKKNQARDRKSMKTGRKEPRWFTKEET